MTVIEIDEEPEPDAPRSTWVVSVDGVPVYRGASIDEVWDIVDARKSPDTTVVDRTHTLFARWGRRRERDRAEGRSPAMRRVQL